MSQDIILEMKGISKSFPGVKALDDVSLTLHKGTVHALMGENGAGKSTLMKILYGIYTKDSGSIVIDGEEVEMSNSRDALEKGVAMIHQELQPIPMMTIAENMYLGRYPKKGPFVDHDKINEEAVKYIEEVGMYVKPTTLLNDLTISQQQSVEIAKAISHNAKIIIMDEPTSSLTENEVSILFGIIRKLTEKGISIIYISHKMDEIFQIADYVTVMRDGKWVSTKRASETDSSDLIKDMVGRELSSQFPDHVSHAKENVALEIKNFSSPNHLSFQDCSFKVYEGEILGVAGLVGAQRSELMEAIFGLREKGEKAQIFKDGKEIKINDPKEAINNGLSLVTEDRRGSGIFGVLPISDNIAIASIKEYLNKFRLINHKAVEEDIVKLDKTLKIKTPSYSTLIQNLSGGNQQKVVLARWLGTGPDIFILDEPTRGIDVGAKYEIYEIIDDLSKQGKTVIMISSELPEILGISDRVMVMSEGKITGYLKTSETNQEEVMTLATKNIKKQEVKVEEVEEMSVEG